MLWHVLVNKSKVYFGLLKEPDISLPVDDDDEAEDGDKPKVRSIEYTLFFKACSVNMMLHLH